MKAKTLIFGILAVAMTLTFSSCDNDETEEQTLLLDNLNAIDKEEITEDDT